MTPQELADKYFVEYKHKDGEYIPTYCPFCEGGRNNDKYTFAMSEDGAYNCKRGSCGVKGSFWDLCKYFDEHPEGMKVEDAIHRRPKKKSYKKPKVKTKSPSSKVESYLKKRGFSKETWQRRGIKEKNGLIVFPYYENGELVLIKYRRPEKYNGKGAKYWQEGGGKPVLWGMDDCDTERPLIITEGEFDALALDEAGVKNATSIPFGTKNTDWIKECWDFIDQFDRIILWTDGDDSGQEMLDEVVPRLGEWRCMVVESEYKDANIQLVKEGPQSVKSAVENAEEVPIRRLMRLSEAEILDPADMPRVLSSIGGINRYLGGYIFGTVTVWTGINESGKSTFLGQEVIESIDQDYPACIYSGELAPGLLRYWLELQMAGPEHVRVAEDRFRPNEPSYYVPKSIRERMRAWYEDLLFLYNSMKASGPDDIMEVFENAARRYGVKIFLVDNLMTISYGGNRGEYYHRQSEFVGRCKDFAERYNVHVHIVAHPKKSDGIVKKEDIAGLYEITNRADNAMAVHRVDDDNREHFASDDPSRDLSDCDSIVDVLKSRIYGKSKNSIGLRFDEATKRFSVYSEQQPKKYGWHKIGAQKELA